VGITASLIITLCRRTELPSYIKIAEALENLDPLTSAHGIDSPQRTPCNSIIEVLEVTERAYAPSARATVEELNLTTPLVRGHIVLEVLGIWNTERDTPPSPFVLPQPRSLADYVLASCKHECSLRRHTRMAKQAHCIFSSLWPVEHASIRATYGLSGRDNAYCSRSTVEDGVRIYLLGALALGDSNEVILFCASALHRFGVPFDYSRLA
jgi:hypothetical protein